jgi:hypothetical protein
MQGFIFFLNMTYGCKTGSMLGIFAKGQYGIQAIKVKLQILA